MYKITKRKDAKRRQVLFAETLLKMLKNYSLNEVSVTDLTKAAKIPRKAFYRYYDNIDDVCCFIIDYLIEKEQIQVWKDYVPNQSDDKQYLIKWLSFWKENRSVMPLLKERKYYRYLVTTIMIRMNDGEIEDIRERTADPRMVRHYFVTNGAMALLECWERNGYKVSEREMAELIIELLSKPLIEIGRK